MTHLDARPYRALALAILGLLLTLALAFPALSGIGTWSGGSGPAGENVGAVAAAPVSPYTLVAANATFGLPRASTDAGATWLKRYAGLPMKPSGGVAFAAGSASVLYYAASGSGIYRSTDAGVTWALSGLPGNTFSCFCACWSNPLRAFAGTPLLNRTTDGGATWGPVGSGPATRNTTAVVIDPTNAQVVYAAMNSGSYRLYRSTNGGDSWSTAGNNLNWGALALAVDPVTPSTLYAATQYGVQKSTDSGANWGAANTGSGRPEAGLEPLVASTNPQSVTALLVDPVTPTTLFAGTPTGLHRSTNGGGFWSEIAPVGRVPVNRLAVDPSGAGRFVAATGGGLKRTTDGGSTWTTLGTGLPADVNAIASDETSLYRIFAGTPGGLFGSTDDGRTWAAMGTSGLWTPITGIATKPSPWTIVVGTPVGLFSSTDGETFVASGDVGGARVNGVVWDGTSQFFVLTAAGLKWTTDGIAMNAVTGLGAPVKVAVQGKGTGVVYAADAQGFISYSNDQGHTFAPTAAQLPDSAKAISLGAHPGHSSWVYAGTVDSVFKSTDAGESWTKMATSPGRVNELVVDPVLFDAVIAATDAGVYVSADGGSTWDELDVGLNTPLPPAVKSLAVSPLNPRKLFAGIAAGGAYAQLAVPEGNQVLNGDFAFDVPPWTFDGTSSGFMVYVTDDASGNPQSGSLYVKVQGGYGVVEGASQPCTPVSDADRYGFGAKVRMGTGSTQGNVKVRVKWYSDGACAAQLGTGETDAFTPGASWSSASKAAIAPPATARSAKVSVVVTNTSYMFQYYDGYFDDVYLKAGIHGDADGNGLVNVSDILFVINHLFAGGPLPLGNADANGDGVVNVSDVLYLINHLFAGGPAPV